MGKKGWFSAMKKAMSPSFAKIKKGKRSHKSKSNPKNSWHENQMSLDTCSSQPEAALANPLHQYHPINENEFKLPETEEIKHVDSVTYTTTFAQEVNCTRSNSHFLGKTHEEIGAIKIQTAYRGYTARRGFRTLRAKMRLHLWIQGQAVKRQTKTTLTRIQTASRVQSQVRARKIRMAEVNEALQRQLIQKRLKVLQKPDFDLSPKSKEQIEARLRSQKEAAERREKALAYAYSRQQTWRNSPKSAYQAVMDPNHFDWGWSWSSRWDAIRPWETGASNEPLGDMGSDSPSRAQSPGQRLKSENSKGLVKATKSGSGSRISKSGSSALGGIRTGSVVVKRHLVTGSPSCGGKRYSGAPGKSSIAVR